MDRDSLYDAARQALSREGHEDGGPGFRLDCVDAVTRWVVAVAVEKAAATTLLDADIQGASTVEDLDDLEEVAGAMGATVILRQVRTGDSMCNHDPLRLAAAFRDAFEGALGDVTDLSGRDDM